MVDKQMEVAKIVRAIMKMHGNQRVFNNIYESGTRTVKCYRNQRGELPVGMLSVIEGVLQQITTRYTVKYTKGSKYGAPGFIVKLYR